MNDFMNNLFSIKTPKECTFLVCDKKGNFVMVVDIDWDETINIYNTPMEVIGNLDMLWKEFRVGDYYTTDNGYRVYVSDH